MGKGLKWTLVAWFVTWVSVSKVPVPCPQDWPMDEYTGEIVAPFTLKSVPCSQTHRKTMQKRFFTQREADLFIANCPEDVCSGWQKSEVKDEKHLVGVDGRGRVCGQVDGGCASAVSDRSKDVNEMR